MPRDNHETVSPNLPIGVRFYESIAKLAEYVPFHWHSSLEVVCVMEGKVTFNIGGNEKTIGPNEFMAVSSGQIHDVSSEPNRAFVLQIPLPVMEKLGIDPKAFDFSAEKKRDPKVYDEIVSLFPKLNQALEKKGYSRLFDAEILLMQILKRLMLRFTTPSAVRHADAPLREIIIYINQHYREKLTIEQLASLEGYNANYFSRLFHKLTGMTVLGYIYQIRLSHFYTALIQTDEDINILMDTYGLKNQRTSRELFKKRYGLLPQELRNKNVK